MPQLECDRGIRARPGVADADRWRRSAEGIAGRSEPAGAAMLAGRAGTRSDDLVSSLLCQQCQQYQHDKMRTCLFFWQTRKRCPTILIMRRPRRGHVRRYHG
jgi:hypothetical protein